MPRRAEAIVSGDRRLLALGSWRGIRIESPAEFLATL
jgi:predicted nucleic acid-binding protein